MKMIDFKINNGRIIIKDVFPIGSEFGNMTGEKFGYPKEGLFFSRENNLYLCSTENIAELPPKLTVDNFIYRTDVFYVNKGSVTIASDVYIKRIKSSLIEYNNTFGFSISIPDEFFKWEV